MTGAGFSVSGNHSMKDNRNLGKIRPESTVPKKYDYQSKINLVDLKSLDQAIQIRIDRKEKIKESENGFLEGLGFVELH